jgi:hypothetical protein
MLFMEPRCCPFDHTIDELPSQLADLGGTSSTPPRALFDLPHDPHEQDDRRYRRPGQLSASINC